MSAQRMVTAATSRHSVPTIQCRVQKHPAAARNISVAAIADSNSRHYCIRNCTSVIP